MLQILVPGNGVLCDQRLKCGSGFGVGPWTEAGRTLRSVFVKA